VTEGDTITFLYNVRPGACGRSFGVAVAELARFPPQVVAAAKRKLADLEDQYGGVETAKRFKDVPEDEELTGKELVAQFMDAVSRLPLDTEADRKASLAAARELRRDILSKGNAYVTNLVNASS
jgi:DNA mismatch repair protein MSH2